MRYAVITGASSGLGAETARQLDGQLDELWLVARRGERLEDLGRSLKTKTRVLALDLSLPEGQAALTEAVRQAYHEGHELEYLVLAAGWGRLGRLCPDTAEAARSMIRLNIESLTVSCAELLPYCEKYVVLYASVAAFLPQPYFAVYAASKSYVLSLSRALRYEYPRLSITAVCPNPVETEFFNHTGESPSGVKTIGIERADKVVATALRRVRQNRPVSLSCFASRSIVRAVRLCPTSLAMKIEKLLGVFKVSEDHRPPRKAVE